MEHCPTHHSIARNVCVESHGRAENEDWSWRCSEGCGRTHRSGCAVPHHGTAFRQTASPLRLRTPAGQDCRPRPVALRALPPARPAFDAHSPREMPRLPSPALRTQRDRTRLLPTSGRCLRSGRLATPKPTLDVPLLAAQASAPSGHSETTAAARSRPCPSVAPRPQRAPPRPRGGLRGQE